MLYDLLKIDSKKIKIEGDLTKDYEDSVKVVRNKQAFGQILRLELSKTNVGCERIK